MLFGALGLGVVKDVPSRAEHTTVTYSQLFDQLSVTALTHDHCKKMLPQARLRAVLIYVCKHKYIEVSLTTCLLSRITVVASP